MQNTDFDKFGQVILAALEYYGKPAGNAIIEIYWQGLKDYDLATISDAVYRHMRNPDTGQFMPKIADIVKMIEGSSNDKALIAWSTVDKAVRTVGPYHDVVFPDKLIHKVIEDMGGWIEICSKQDDEWPFVAKEFENRYRCYSGRVVIPEYQPKLLGLITASNAQEGYALKEPVMIENAIGKKQVELLQ